MINLTVKSKLVDVKDCLINSKKYWLIFLICFTILGLSTVSHDNILHPKFELLMFFVLVFLGIFSIVYYFRHNSEKELFKVAFVIILCFGIITSFIVPIVDVSDEVEHLTRAEITSNGIIFPHWTGDDVGIDRLYNHTDKEFSDAKNLNVGFETIRSLDFYDTNREVTVFQTNHDTDKINHTTFIKGSAFEQNPFYGYLPQALGILIAKLFDLNVIWMLWLGRICNLICYVGLISLAIKITPKLKIPLLTVACIPITIYQAASISIDSMLFGLGILTIAYFIKLCMLQDNSIEIKKILIYAILCLLMGLCKLPYLAFIFLILFIPKNKFKNDTNTKIMVLLSIFVVAIIGILWSRYSTPTLMHSWRSQLNYVNSTQQINFLINNPNQFLSFFKQIFTTDLVYVFNGVFNFFNGKLGLHYQDNYNFITLCLQIFLAIVLFAYPNDEKFDLKTRVGAFLIILIVYIGTCFIQLLTWAYVGQMGLGILVRYFIPLFALIPIVVNTNYFKNAKLDKYCLVLIVTFMATLVFSFVTKYY